MAQATFYPDASPETSSVDGFVLAESPTPTTFMSFADLRDKNGDFSFSAGAIVGLFLKSSAAFSDAYIEYDKPVLFFDTSSIPDGATITAAHINLYPTYKEINLGATDVEVVGVSAAPDSYLTSSMYQAFDDTVFSAVATGSITLDEMNQFDLDSSGIAAINKAGTSKFGLRWGYESTPGDLSYALDTFNSIIFVTAEGSEGQRPELVVTYTSELEQSPSGTLLFSASMTAETEFATSPSGTLLFSGQATTSKTIVPVEGKSYLYKVYDSDDNFVGIWRDVRDDLQFSQPINTPGTVTTVRLSRSASRKVQVREPLHTESGEPITTEDDEELIVVAETDKTVGEGTDVELNYNVDVYVFYGTFETLTTEDGEPLTTEDGDELIVQSGFPNGRRVFSGYILDYSAVYGASSGVTVTLASHGAELANQIIKDGSDTTVSYSSQDHADIIKDVLDTNPGLMSYDANSIQDTGDNVSQVFRLNTKKEGIEAVYDQSPEGFYWFGGVGDRMVHFKNKSSTADHTFVLGKHIQSIDLSRSMEGLVNESYFVGGDTGGGSKLYKYNSDATSLTNWRSGVDRRIDSRVTTTDYVTNYKTKLFDRFSSPIFTTSVTIPSEVYEIESISLGQMVGFRNFGNFVDDLLLQIVSINYSPYSITLQLGDVLMSQNDIINTQAQDAQDSAFSDIPDAPS